MLFANVVVAVDLLGRSAEPLGELASRFPLSRRRALPASRSARD